MMDSKMKRRQVSIVMTLALTFSVPAVSRSQSFNAPRTKSGLQTKYVPVGSGLRVYFLPLHSATLIPIGRDFIKQPGGLTLYSPEDVNTLLKLLEPSVSSTPGPSVALAQIDNRQIRLRVEESRGEHLIFVDSRGVVDNAGKVYKLTSDAERKLNQFIGNLWAREEAGEISSTRH